MQAVLRRLNRWPPIVSAGATLAALALLWRVRDAPLELGAVGRIDALGAFFALVSLGALTLNLALGGARPARARLTALATVALLLAYSTTVTLAIAGCYALVALLGLLAGGRMPRYPRPARLADRLRRWATHTPGALAALCLLIGYGALALHGAARYTDRTAGAALDSFAFWFVLLAAALPLWNLGFVTWGRATAPSEPPSPKPQARAASYGLLQIAWLYPLARLYSLGPWNGGWSLATALLGGAAAGWCAVSALAQREPGARRGRVAASYFGLALAGIGLGSSAGLAAACYAIFASLLVAATIDPAQDQETTRPGDNPPAPALRDSRAAGWLLSGALPFTTPFVAAWMLVGAGVAGGVGLLSGVAWLVALLGGLTTALSSEPDAGDTRRARLSLGALSLALGIGAPLVVRELIQPVAAQLQGGLTPYGELNIWPWVGLASADAAHTQVTTLPSIAIALLMLVLFALVYVATRLREHYGAPPAAPANESAAPEASALLDGLRDDVPWLGALLGRARPGEERRRDAE